MKMKWCDKIYVKLKRNKVISWNSLTDDSGEQNRARFDLQIELNDISVRESLNLASSSESKTKKCVIWRWLRRR